MDYITRREAEKMMKDKFNMNYYAGVPRIPPHTHNGIDNLRISSSDLTGSIGGGLNGIQVFTSSGTFTVPTGYTKFWVRGVGGGGGSDSSINTVSSGGGGYCEKLCDLTGVTSVTVTIGAGGTAGTTTPTSPTDGGDTSFGSYFTAGGGKAATTGGTATGGDVNIPGESGGAFITLFNGGTSSNFNTLTGKGGNSMLGLGGRGAYTSSGQNPFSAGIQGTGYGAGASSAGTATGAGANSNGAAGTGGIIIIIW